MAKLLFEVKDEIAWIRLNRPEVLNALSSEELGAFVGALRKAADDPEVKAIIISSVGDSFCAGEDLKIALAEYPQIKTGEIHPILDIVEDISFRGQPQAPPAQRRRNRPRGDPGTGKANRYEHDLHRGLR